MLLIALKLQLAALVTVAGINTDDIKSPSVKTELEKLDKARTSGADINQASTEAIKAIAELTKSDDADALYAMALWSRIGVLNGANAQQLLDWYTKAADKGQVPAQAELGTLLIQNFPQDAEKVAKGLGYIKSAEGANNAGARRVLAQLTITGLPAANLKSDVTKGMALFEKGSAAGDGEASFDLSQIYASGIKDNSGEDGPKEVLKQDLSKSLEMLELAVKQENAPAMSDLASRLLIGDKQVKTDPARAMTILGEAAKKGSAPAERQLGVVYEQGLGGQTKDTDKAAEHYAAAARGNDGVAQLWMGNAAQNGLLSEKGQAKVKALKKDEKPDLKPEDVLVAPNPAAALNYYRLAAQNNVPQAIYNVGLFYENGAVVDKDPTKAFALVQKAAQANIPVAQYKLGTYYQNGSGIGQDVVAAAGWYKRAADNDLPAAKLVYGAMLESGIGEPKSAMAAAAQYEDAASKGLAQAMVSLASLYFRGGDNLQPKKELAWVYASLAVDASNNDPKAVKFRDEIGEKLTEKQKADAKKLYEDKKASVAAGGSAASTSAPAVAPATTAPTSNKPPQTGTKKKK